MYKEIIEEYETLLANYQKKVGQGVSKEDLSLRHEVLFSAHSCAIEGNSFTVGDTQELKEKGLGLIPHGKTLFEAFEILDHFKAYEYVLENRERPLSEEFLKECHAILMKNTLAYRIPGAVAGEYTDTDMCAGDTIFGDHKELIARVPALLESTQKAIDEAKQHPVVLAARFHGFFKCLYPFRDGNGRLGRLFSNLILSKMGKPMLVIHSADRQEYIGALNLIRKERTDEYLIRFFFNSAMKQMKEEIKEYDEGTKRMKKMTFVF